MACRSTLKNGRPIYLVFDHDLAGLVGTILRDDFAIENPLLCLDGVTLSDFDFIDLGKTLEPSGTVPVTIKSLCFSFKGTGPSACLLARATTEGRPYSCLSNFAASVPAINPCVAQRPIPCWLKPPADSPAQ